jgi:hypothetical protein
VAAIGATVCVFLLVAAALILVRPAVASAPGQSTATVDGLRYTVNNAWILDPHRRVDAKLAEGLPASDAHLPPDELLFAVFVGVTNETGSPRRMVSDIALRDTSNRNYAPTRLAPDNRFAYAPTVLHGKSHVPASGAPAETDISADGLMLVFRIPRRAYTDGPLQLLLHGPRQPGSVHALPIA